MGEVDQDDGDGRRISMDRRLEVQSLKLDVIRDTKFESNNHHSL